MPDTKITALAAITTVDPAADVLPIVDISDTSMAASGTTKKITSNQILGAGGTATLASATITGDLTVDTSTLKVDSATDRVGVGTASPAVRFNIADSDNAANGTIRLGVGAIYSQIKMAASSTGATEFTNVGNGANGAYNFSIDGQNQYKIATSGVFNWYDGAGGTRMTLNANGLGIGVTPSAWGSNFKVTQVGQAGAVYGSAPTGFYGTKFNIYNDNTNDISITNNFVGEYRFNILNGSHIWLNKSTSSGGVGVNQTLTQAMTLDASGVLAIGTVALGFTSSMSSYFTPVAGYWIGNHATGTASGERYWGFGYGVSEVGSITQNGTTGVLYNITSDYRLKEQVQPLVGGLARVNALKPSVYKWKSDGSNGEGFLAHELAEVVPFAVTGEKDAVNEDGSIKSQGIDMSRVVPILVAAIQELAARVQTLETR